jgi:hypothetical protein
MLNEIDRWRKSLFVVNKITLVGISFDDLGEVGFEKWFGFFVTSNVK